MANKIISTKHGTRVIDDPSPIQGNSFETDVEYEDESIFSDSERSSDGVSTDFERSLDCVRTQSERSSDEVSTEIKYQTKNATLMQTLQNFNKGDKALLQLEEYPQVVDELMDDNFIKKITGIWTLETLPLTKSDYSEYTKQKYKIQTAKTAELVLSVRILKGKKEIAEQKQRNRKLTKIIISLSAIICLLLSSIALRKPKVYAQGQVIRDRDEALSYSKQWQHENNVAISLWRDTAKVRYELIGKTKSEADEILSNHVKEQANVLKSKAK